MVNSSEERALQLEKGPTPNKEVAYDSEDKSSFPPEEETRVLESEKNEGLIEVRAFNITSDSLIVQPEINGDSLSRPLTLIDTGAATSLINEKFLENLNKDHFSIKESRFKGIKGIGKNIIPIIGDLNLSLKFSKFVTKPSDYVVVSKDTTEYDIICGVNVLKTNGLLPDLEFRQLLKRDVDGFQVIAKDCRDLSHPDTYDLEINERVDIFPGTFALVPISSVDRIIDEINYFEGNTKISGLEIIPGLINLDHKTSVAVYNKSDRKIILKEHTKIGKAYKNYEIPNINSLNIADGVKASGEVTPWTEQELVQILDLKESCLDEESSSKVLQLLHKYSKTISKGDGDVGHATLIKHEIETTTETPIQVPTRRIQGPLLQEIERCCLDMEKQGIIERSRSPYSAPVVPIRKPDGSLRLCIDYRELNKVTKTNHFPLPNLIDMLYNLHGIKYFSTIDLVKGYYQIEVAPNSIEKTAFSTPLSHWHFLRMPFGLKCAPSTFQRGMMLALSGIPWNSVMCYLDDIIVLGKSFQDHLVNLEKLLSALQEHGLKLIPRRPNFFKLL